MKKQLISSLLIIPLLTSCGGNSGTVVDHVPEDYVPTLPQFKNKDNGTIKSDDTYDYLDIYELSDFHGAVDYSKEDNRLGIEKLSSYFDKKREDNPGGSIILSGGDMWQGSADSNVTRGNLITYSMDVMGFASMTLGNHEFDWTTSWIKNNKDRATFPFLCANLIDKTTGEVADFVKASTTVTRGDYKIGIIGTIGENIKDTILASSVANYDFASEIDTVVSESAKLRADGCDVVIWSSHNDISYLKTKIGSTDLGVDLIFGGHTHTTMVDEINGIPMLESKDLGRSIPHCELKINKSSKEVTPVEGYGCDENPTSGEYANDADISGIYNQYKENYINPVKNQKLGKANGDFSIEQLANLAVESMYKRVIKDLPDLAKTPRATFTNVNGGVRSTLKGGDISYGDIYTIFPFDNEIVIMEATGKNIQSWVGGGLSNAAMYQDIYTYGTLSNSEKYYFITTDFLATNSQFFAGKGEVINYTKINVRDCVADAIRQMGTIKADDYKTTAKKEFQKIS